MKRTINFFVTLLIVSALTLSFSSCEKDVFHLMDI